MASGTLAVEWQRTVRCFQFAEDCPAPRPGYELVLEPPTTHAIELPAGTLLDDLLTRTDREALDAAALARLRAFGEARREHLRGAGVDLVWIWETELLAEVFLPETRNVEGAARVLGRAPVERVELGPMDGELREALDTALRAGGLDVAVVGPDRLPPAYPGRRANPWRVPWHRRIRHGWTRRIGVPGMAVGRLVFLPYWNLVAFHRRLAGWPTLRPVYDPFRLPPGPAWERFGWVARGGWVARPGWWSARRSSQKVAGAIRAAARVPNGGDSLDGFLRVRALRLLAQRAGETPAIVGGFRRAFLKRRIRGALLPFDSPPDPRMIVTAARSAGKPVVVAQHGFWAEPNDPDKTEADVVAVWSARDAAELQRRTAGAVEIVGNPAADRLARPHPPVADRDPCTLVLPEYPSRVSLWVPARVTLALLDVALEALSRTRPETVALLRPHPADHDVDAYAQLAAEYPALRVEVDVAAPIESLIARADLCIGGVSTALLQAGAAGVATIFLNVAGVARPFPFDGSGAVPTATDAGELTALIPRVLAQGADAVEPVVRDALGVRGDAADRLLWLLDRRLPGTPAGGPAPDLDRPLDHPVQ